MSYPHRRLLICTAAVVDAANALYASAIDRDGAGEYTFSVPLSSGSPRRITHYAADTSMTDAQLSAFPTAFAALIAAGDVIWSDSSGGRASVKATLNSGGRAESDEPRGRFKGR